MATVTTTENITPRFVNWVNPSNIGGNRSGIPTGRLVFASNFAIPSKDAADINVSLVNMTLPRNFVYRLETWNVNTMSTSVNGAVSTDIEKGIGCRIELEEIGSTGKIFRQMACPATQYGPSVNATNPRFDIVFATAGTLLGLVSYARPSDYNDLLLDTEVPPAISSMQLSLVDQSADSTITMSFVTYVTFLQFTTDALNSWPLNTPSLVTGSQ